MPFSSEFGMSPREDDEGLFSRDIDGQLVRLDPATEDDFQRVVTVQIDGQEVKVPVAEPLKDAQGNIVQDINGRVTPRYTTILDAVVKLNGQRKAGDQPIAIPILCHQPHMTPVAVCRLCAVEVWGQRRGKRSEERKLLPACQSRVKDGMEVFTMQAVTVEGDPNPYGEKVRRSVLVLTKLLAADHLKPAPAPAPAEELAEFNELGQLADRCQREFKPEKWESISFDSEVFSRTDPSLPVVEPPIARRKLDSSSPVFLVDHTACILCDRCSRACNEVKNNQVIGRTGKGRTAGIGFDLNDKMFESSCVQCGECMISCPTSAITFKPAGAVEVRNRPAGEPVPLAELRQDPLFAEVPPKLLLWQKGLVRRLRLKPKEIICRQGDPGNSAFRIKRGVLNIQQRDSLGRLAPPISRGVEDVILGEMACLSGNPRNADIYALGDAEVWEVRRNVLDRMMRSRTQRGLFERLYRERALPTALHASELFLDLQPKDYDNCIEFLKPRLKFVRVNPGDTIFNQGDAADHLYLVRLGHVRVGNSRFGQDETMLYLGPGTVIGEMGALAISEADAHKSVEGLSRALYASLSAGKVPQGRRTATCTALDHVELARIDQSDFIQLVLKIPQLLANVIAMILKRLNEPHTPQTRQFVEQGLYQGQSLLVLDLTRCTRCDECTRACIQQHGTETHGQPITRLLREGLRFGEYLVATSCRSCKDAYCMIGCPVDAIHRGKHNQIVIEDHCIGCGLCAQNCPYGSIFMEENTRDLIEADDPDHPGRLNKVARPKAAACDLCDAEGKEGKPSPRCVHACPHEAAHRLTGKNLLERILAASTDS